MTTIELYLEPAAAKVFLNYYEGTTHGPLALKDHFRKIVWLAFRNSMPDRQRYDPRLNTLVEVQMPIYIKRPIEKPYVINARNIRFIHPFDMELINDMVVAMLQFEINLKVDFNRERNLEVKQAILETLDKYDIDEQNEYKYETALAKNIRFRNRRSGDSN